MSYIPEEAKVVYQSKDGKEEKIFDVLEWLAAMCCHPPALPDMQPNRMEIRGQGGIKRHLQEMGDGLGGQAVPNKGEQMVRYVGFYSNVSRGKRKKQNQDGVIPSILDPDGSSKEHRKNWAKLIQKIYEVDPLICPKCQGRMRIISFIEDAEIIKKILKHLGLWEVKPRPPPQTKQPPQNVHIDYSDSQVPPCEDDLYYDPDYPIEAYDQS